MAPEYEPGAAQGHGPASSDELRALVQRALDGEREAAAEIYTRYYALVLAIGLRLSGGDLALAQDLTQDAFAKALYRLDRFEWRGPDSLRGWIATIARNTFRDHVRSAAERHHGGYELPVIIDDGLGPEEIVVEYHVEGAAHEAGLLLEQLSPEHALVLRLTLGEGRSTSEVAEELGRSQGAIHQLKRRALAAARSLATAD